MTVEPNESEQRLATDVIVDQWSNPHALAELLAAAREGATLEGPRVIVSGEAMVPSRVFLGPEAEAVVEGASAHAWRSWFRELHRQNLRPCGWPVEQRTWLAYRFDGPLEVDREQADRLLISVSCEAVPIT